MREVIATNDGPKAIGPYSQAIKANGFVFRLGTGGARSGDAAGRARAMSPRRPNAHCRTSPAF